MISNTSNSRNNKLHKLVIYAATSSLFILPLASCSTGRVEQSVQQVQKIISAYDQEIIAKNLIELTSLEIDSYHAYAEISKKINNKEFRKFCEQTQAERKDRIVVLSKILVDMNIISPLFSEKFAGFTTSGFTLIQGAKNQHIELVL